MSTIDENPICRACLTKTGDFASIHSMVATEDIKMELTLQDCWRQCMLWSGYEKLADIEDMLPDYMCMQCSQDVQVAYNFLKNAIEALSTFRKKVGLDKCKDEYAEPLRETVDGVFDISEVKEELILENYEFVERELETERPPANFEPENQLNNCEGNEECTIAESPQVLNAKVEVVDLSSDNDSNNLDGLEGNDTDPNENNEGSELDIEVSCVCGTKIKSSQMKSHQSKCSRNTRGINCRVCFGSFPDRPSLAAHQREKHPKNMHDSGFQCKLCSNTYHTKTQLQKHLKRHQARIHKCDECELDFPYSSQLSKHRLINHLPYKCDKCPAAYRYSSTLQAHKGREHMTRCFVCKVSGCGARFRSQLQLNAHKYKHIGNPYKCEHCSQDYLHRETFRIHNQTAHNICLTEEELTKIYQKHMINAHDGTDLVELQL